MHEYKQRKVCLYRSKLGLHAVEYLLHVALASLAVLAVEMNFLGNKVVFKII